MSAQLAEDARALRAKLAPEGAWTQGESARSAKGRSVDPCGRSAACWCLDGARISLELPIERSMALAAGMAAALDGRVYVLWNDAPGRTQAEVLAMLDRVIAAAEAQS